MMNSLLPTLSLATASVGGCILFTAAVFELVNRLLTKTGSKALTGRTALLASAGFGLLVGGFVFGFQHQHDWTSNIFSLIVEAIQVAAGSTMGYALIGTAVVKPLQSWGVKNKAAAQVEPPLHPGESPVSYPIGQAPASRIPAAKAKPTT
jgi:hypothetical protein